MSLLQTIISLVALCIALRALYLQRREVEKNGKINSLIHLSSMVQLKIEYYSRIIDDIKNNGGKWKGHAEKINKELRPLKEDIDNKLIDLISRYEGMPEADKIGKAIIKTRNGSYN